MASINHVNAEWHKQTGSNAGTLKHVGLAMVAEGLLSGSGKGGGKAVSHMNAEGFAYYAIANAALAAGYTVADVPKVARVVFKSRQVANALTRSPPPSSLDLGDRIACEVERFARLAQLGEPAEEFDLRKEYTFFFRRKGYPVFLIQAGLGNFPRNTQVEFFYLTELDKAAEYARLIQPSHINMAIGCSATLTGEHLQLLGRALLDSWQRTVTAPSDLGPDLPPGSKQKSAASLPQEAAPSDDPDTQAATTPPAQDRALNKPDRSAHVQERKGTRKSRGKT